MTSLTPNPFTAAIRTAAPLSLKLNVGMAKSILAETLLPASISTRPVRPSPMLACLQNASTAEGIRLRYRKMP